MTPTVVIRLKVPRFVKERKRRERTKVKGYQISFNEASKKRRDRDNVTNQ